MRIHYLTSNNHFPLIFFYQNLAPSPYKHPLSFQGKPTPIFFEKDISELVGLLIFLLLANSHWAIHFGDHAQNFI